MTKKEELIVGILKKELIHINKMLKEQELQIADITKNGFDKEIHKGNRDGIWTGLHYTLGYCTAHIYNTKGFIELLKLKDHKAVEKLIKENETIEKQNKAELKKIFDDIKKNVQKKTSKK